MPTNLHARGWSCLSELIPRLEELELAEPVGVGVVEQVVLGEPADNPRQHLATGRGTVKQQLHEHFIDEPQFHPP